MEPELKQSVVHHTLDFHTQPHNYRTRCYRARKHSFSERTSITKVLEEAKFCAMNIRKVNANCVCMKDIQLATRILGL